MTPYAPSRLPLVHYPEPILARKADPITVTGQTRTLALDMIHTMRAERGIGLAAPQVGLPIRMFVVDVEWVSGEPAPYVFVNPAIVSASEEKVDSVEGCLSFPGESIWVPRHKKVVIFALDERGESFTLEAEGLLSVVIQHEFDHIEGRTFADLQNRTSLAMMKKRLAKRAKKASRT
jgi:peptide deformylase